jgi:hypothetical protein
MYLPSSECAENKRSYTFFAFAFIFILAVIIIFTVGNFDGCSSVLVLKLFPQGSIGDTHVSLRYDDFLFARSKLEAPAEDISTVESIGRVAKYQRAIATAIWKWGKSWS